MNKNNKGFTLVELLAVIIILGIILAIAIPNIQNIIQQTRQKAYEAQIELFKEGVKKYVALYFNEIDNPEQFMVTLTTLQSKKLIDRNVKDPRTNQPFENLAFLVRKIGGKYKYELFELPVYHPELATGMMPVYYDEDEPDANNRWKKADFFNISEDYKWYDYDIQQWANAVTVVEAQRDYYMNEANMGDPININHINTMWVWIPRYKYKIPAGTGPREIEVEFESKNSKSSGDAVNSYLTHPAFTFGGKELSGIWIGKFEISGTATGDDITSLTILPDKAPLYGKAIRVMFEALKNIMQADPNDIYGFGGHMDIHIIKNSEWGAVAYLYHSKYGKYGNSLYSGANKEIYKNPKNNATGNSSGTPAGVSGTTCAYNVIADRGNGIGACGAGASTTGNIYGIYDMVGGYYEYVLAAYIPDPLPTPSNIGDASGFSSTTSNSRFEYLPAEKYYDIYRSTSIATACSEGKCLGQALEEIDGWYSDTGTFVITSMPWIVRSGSYSGNDSAVGIFYYNRDNGEGIFGAYVGSIVVRPTLVVDDSL